MVADKPQPKVRHPAGHCREALRRVDQRADRALRPDPNRSQRRLVFSLTHLIQRGPIPIRLDAGGDGGHLLRFDVIHCPGSKEVVSGQNRVGRIDRGPKASRPSPTFRRLGRIAVPLKDRIVEIVDQPLGRPSQDRQLPDGQQLPLEEHGVKMPR